MYLYLKSLTICSRVYSCIYLLPFSPLHQLLSFDYCGHICFIRRVRFWSVRSWMDPIMHLHILLLSFAILKAQWWEYKCYFLIYCFLIYAHLHFSIPFAALTMQIFTRCGTNKELLSYLITLLIGVQEEAWGPVPKHTTKSLNKTKVKYVFFALRPFNISQIKWNGKN